jgi:hypothetical protein
MTDDRQNPDPAQVPRRKWKQAEALEAIEILKAKDPEKWTEYVHQELNGAQIDMDLASWMINVLAPVFKSDSREVLGLFGKLRSNINPIWIKDRVDD